MSAFKKIAVTIPAETYRSLEQARDKLGKTRSEVVAFAVKEWLRGLDASEQSRRYLAGYLRTPEAPADESFVGATTAEWSSWSSWEPGPAPRASEPKRGRRR